MVYLAQHPAPPPRRPVLGRLAVAWTRRSDERGSAAVEYVGLGVVVSMLMAAGATAVDSALGEQLARAIVERMVESVASVGS